MHHANILIRTCKQQRAAGILSTLLIDYNLFIYQKYIINVINNNTVFNYAINRKTGGVYPLKNCNPMKHQHLVSVCSYTGIVILLIACRPTHTTVYTNAAPPPETRIIVVKQPPRVVEKVVVVKEPQQ